MNVAAIAGALALSAVAPFEHFMRALYGDGAAGFMATGALAGLAMTGAVWGTGSRPSAAGLPVAGWIGLGVVASLTVGGMASVPAVSGMALAGAWFLLGLRFGSVKWLGAGLVLGGVAAALLAIWQVSGGLTVPDSALVTLDRLDPALSGRVRARLAEPRGFGFFVYPNALGGFLIMALPFAAAWRVAGGGIGATAAIIVLGAGLVASGSIGAAGCLAAAATIAWLRRGRLRAGRGAILAGFAVLAAVLLLRPPTSVSGGLSGRMALWGASLRPTGMIAGLIGAGPGRFGEVVRDRVTGAAWSRHAHNWFSETFAELGLAGLLALLWALRRPHAGAVMAFSARDPWSRAAAAAWVAGGLHALIDIDYALPVLSAPWWGIAGWLAAGAPALRRVRRPVWPAVRIPGWAVLAGAVVLVAVLRGAAAVAAEGVVLGGAVAWLWYRRITRGDAPPVALRADAPWLALGAIAGLWMTVSPAPDRSIASGLEVGGFLALILVARRLLIGRLEEASARACIIAVGTVFAGWAVLEALVIGGSGRGPFPSPNTLAAWLAFALALAAGSLQADARSLGAGVVLIAGLLATGSAGGGLAALIASLAVLWSRVPRARRRPVAFVAGVGVVALAVAVVVQRGDGLSAAQRLTMWREAARLLAADPAGSGPGRYGDLAAAVRQPSVTASGVGRFSLGTEFVHSEPLQFAVEWGLPALGVLIWALVAAWRLADRRRRGWLAGLAALGLHGLVDFPFRAPPIAVLAAVALGAATWRARRGAPPTMRRADPLAWLVAAWCAVACLRPAASRIAVQAGDPERAARLWPVSADAASASARIQAQRAFGLRGPSPLLARAEESFNRALDLGGGRWTGHLELGRFLHARGVRTGASADLDDAAEAFGRAADGAPWSPHILIARAELAMTRRRWREAEAHYVEALRREPFCVAAAAGRAEVLARRGHRDEARRVVSAAIVLQAHALQRPGLNEYERGLLSTPDAVTLRRRLIGLGGPP